MYDYSKIGSFTSIVLLIGFVVFIFHLQKIDEAQDQLRSLKARVTGLENELIGATSALESKRQQLAQATEKNKKGLDLKVRSAVATSERNRLQVELLKLEKEYSVEQKRRTDQLREARAAMIGKEYAQIRIGNQTLNRARITKITDTSITLLHSGGTCQAATIDLPADLTDRLGLIIVLK
jgi:hypothetical protein